MPLRTRDRIRARTATATGTTEMVKTTLLLGLLALALFTTAQYRGWNLFDTAAQPVRSGGGVSRVYHK